MFFCQFGDNTISNPPLWTINIELWGSALVFGLCLAIGKLPKVWRMTLLCLLALCLKNTYYVAFIIGMILVDFYKNWTIDWFIRYRDMLSYVLLIPAVIYCSYPYYLSGSSSQYWTNTGAIISGYPMLGSILLFIIIISNDRCKQMLEVKPLIFIGSISYSIYVIHQVILHAQMQNISNFVNSFAANVYLSFGLIITLSMINILLISWAVDKLVDKPCIKFSGWLAKNLFQ